MCKLQLTPLSWKLQSTILSPVGVAEVAEATVLVNWSPLVPAGSHDTVTTLAALLVVGSNGNSLGLGDGRWYDSR